VPVIAISRFSVSKGVCLGEAISCENSIEGCTFGVKGCQVPVPELLLGRNPFRKRRLNGLYLYALNIEYFI